MAKPPTKKPPTPSPAKKSMTWGKWENSSTDKNADASIKQRMGSRAPKEGSRADNKIDKATASKAGVKLTGSPNAPRQPKSSAGSTSGKAKVDHLEIAAKHNAMADMHRATASLHEAKARLQDGSVKPSSMGGMARLALPGE